eukprot:GHVN01079854.1.p1 GENE.GHVN01079854.1~~GHVN01079854.1.p1  ORF type:complete len:527 (-),score=80.04 GHVN01079854.1:182-1762(-)
MNLDSSRSCRDVDYDSIEVASNSELISDEVDLRSDVSEVEEGEAGGFDDTSEVDGKRNRAEFEPGELPDSIAFSLKRSRLGYGPSDQSPSPHSPRSPCSPPLASPNLEAEWEEGPSYGERPHYPNSDFGPGPRTSPHMGTSPQQDTTRSDSPQCTPISVYAEHQQRKRGRGGRGGRRGGWGGETRFYPAGPPRKSPPQGGRLPLYVGRRPPLNSMASLPPSFQELAPAESVYPPHAPDMTVTLQHVDPHINSIDQINKLFRPHGPIESVSINQTQRSAVIKFQRPESVQAAVRIGPVWAALNTETSPQHSPLSPHYSPLQHSSDPPLPTIRQSYNPPHQQRSPPCRPSQAPPYAAPPFGHPPRAPNPHHRSIEVVEDSDFPPTYERRYHSAAGISQQTRNQRHPVPPTHINHFHTHSSHSQPPARKSAPAVAPGQFGNISWSPESPKVGPTQQPGPVIDYTQWKYESDSFRDSKGVNHIKKQNQNDLRATYTILLEKYTKVLQVNPSIFTTRYPTTAVLWWSELFA